MRRVIFSRTGLARVEILGASANEREQFAVLDLRNRAEHRQVDQSRTPGFDQRHKLARGHRLQCAHFDKQLAFDITGQEPVRTVENVADAVILGNDRDDDFRFGGQGAGICRDPQSARSQRLVSVGIAIPAHDVEPVLAQTVGHRCAHSTSPTKPIFIM